MWALRRASTPIKSQAVSKVSFRATCAKTELSSYDFEGKSGFIGPPPATADKNPYLKRLFSSACNSPQSFFGMHSFSSQTGERSSGEEDDDLEDGFSELETPLKADTREGTIEDESDYELISEVYTQDDTDKEPQNDMKLSDIEAEIGEKFSRPTRVYKGLYNAMMDGPGPSVSESLDIWVNGGNEVTRKDIATTMIGLRNLRLYGRALQLSEWLESSKQIEFAERDYACRLDLIAKVKGLQEAESYIKRIPEVFKGELIYQTLLANCVSTNNLRKAEAVFNEMKDLKLEITSFTCNQLLLLYKKTDKNKIADILLFMERENIKPSLFTYKVLADTKGQSKDISGMEQIVEAMKEEGLEPDSYIQAVLARHYISAGLKEKAETVLKEMEGSNLSENRWACAYILPLYASLGNCDDVSRIWKVCEPDPRMGELMAAIDAWGKLKKVEEAEAVFDLMSKRLKKVSSKPYSIMLKVYAHNKMLSKGKELAKQMVESGCHIGPLTYDALVRLYVESGEVEKADSILKKAARQRVQPMFNTYMTIMDQYSKRGDIHNAEKIFLRMRQAGHVSSLRQYQSLLQTYINAKVPAYGIRERMKGDNIYPNKGLAAQLAHVDEFWRTAVSFWRTAVSDLLD